MTKDLTQGSPVRLILGFALPLLAGMLFQQLYNLVDTLIVGRFLGMEALAGVGATGSINFLVLGFCMGICSGFAIPVAQQFGAHEESRMREFVSNGTWLSIVFAVVMTVLTVVYCADILRLMNTPEDCFDQAYNYIVVYLRAFRSHSCIICSPAGCVRWATAKRRCFSWCCLRYSMSFWIWRSS